jgi:hypothetical protein
MDLFYNGILVAIVLVWVLSLRNRELGKIMPALRRLTPVATLVLWAVFVAFLAWYVMNFEQFEDMHDIDEAVATAVESATNDINPYEEYVIPRFKDKYFVGVDWTYGPYNYMPLDLLVYIAAEAALGSLGSPYWFVAANIVFAGAAMVLIRGLTRTRWLPFLPLAGTVVLFYSMDNASLTLLLMAGSIYVLRLAEDRAQALSLLLMGLAVLTKVYAAIPFLVMLLFFSQSQMAARDWRRLAETAVAAGVAGAVALLVMLPFGVGNVLDAAVFFHTSEESRVGTSSGGTLLGEIALDSPYFAIAGAAVTVAAVLAGLRMRSLNDRVMLVIVAFLLVAVKSSLAPLTVAGLFLALRMHELREERRALAALRSPSGPVLVQDPVPSAPAER